MSYKALYREWRPKNFDEMVGQKHITKVLKNQIKKDHTGHAYLFCGTRGTGKTSAAKILAKGVNCLKEDEKPCGTCENCRSIQDETFMDVIEIDAASNNGVDNIRELRESIKYPPAKGRYKVYIIDEVHMLSTGAFNALLKTLEEPPSYVKFVLATTEVHKLPATILSRCQRFDFKRITEQEIANRMKYICDHLGVEIEISTLMLIARNSEGSARDALSTLDQCVALGNKQITYKDIVDILGTVDEDFMIQLTNCIIEKDTSKALSFIQSIVTEGKDIQQFIKDWIYHYRNLLMTKISDDLDNIVSMSPENIGRLKMQGEKLEVASISNAIMELSKTAASAKWSSQPRILLELAIVKLSQPEMDTSINGLLQRIALLEKSIKNKNFDKSNYENQGNAEEEIYIKEDASLFVEKNIEKPKEPIKEKIKKEETKGQDHHDSTYSKADLQKLWGRIIKDARNERPSLTMLSQGVSLNAINATSFVIYTESDAKREYILRNRELMEEIFAKHTSKALKLECHAGTSDDYQEGVGSETEIRKELESVFGSEKVIIEE